MSNVESRVYPAGWSHSATFAAKAHCLTGVAKLCPGYATVGCGVATFCFFRPFISVCSFAMYV